MTHTQDTTPANPAQVTDDWLVTNGPDGLCAKVAVGFDSLKREVVAAVFGDGDDTSEEAQDMRDRLDTPGDWEGDRWCMSWSFEDGYLNVQRITDLTALIAAIGAGGQAVAFEGQGLTPYGGFLKVHINGVAYSHAMLVSRLRAANELDEIAKMFDAGQGDDDGAQILPDFSPDMSVVAKVESCLHSLEDNRDLIEALSHPDPAVKLLEWRPLASGCGAEAYSIVGKYWVRDGQFWAPGCTVPKPFRTDEAAKAAAQADYERRILSTLDHPAQPGWRLVPEDPTEAMIQSCFPNWPSDWRGRLARDTYTTMVAAAPQPKGE